MKRRQIRLSDELDEALKDYADRNYRGNVNMAVSYLLEAALGTPGYHKGENTDRPKAALGFTTTSHITEVTPKAPIASPEVIEPPLANPFDAFSAFDKWVDDI